MLVAEALDVRPGQVVLDLAAAPGGKATHLAALLGGAGLLVTNEVVRARIKPLGENLERWGVRNAVILNDRPERIADALGSVFDRVLLDAPCSGEGMFRKSPAARAEWSQEHVDGSANRQRAILAAAARTVRPGGLLLYSTCTFAPEENEQVIATFLTDHPAWELRAIRRPPGVDPGRPGWVKPPDPRLDGTARIWPHRAPGEGHFLGLLRAPVPSSRAQAAADVEAPPAAAAHGTVTRAHAGPTPERFLVPRNDNEGARRRPVNVGAPSPEAITAWRDFAGSALTASLPEKRVVQQGSRLVLRPEMALDLTGLSVVREGLWLGEARPGRFEPSHALALALTADDATQRLDLDETTALRYLAGETLEAPGAPGWLLVTVRGFPLGWGRRHGATVKNHYPKGLRRSLA
jgi:NOL1/NOP2/fmu family ribosome biogenesis protein